MLRAALLVMVGCGRIGFDPLGAGGDDVISGDGRLGDGNGVVDDGLMIGGPDQINVSEINGSNIAVNVTLPKSVAIDDVIVLAIGWRSAVGTVSSVNDDLGNVYPVVCNLVRGGTVSQELRVGRVSFAGASPTITVTTTVTSPGLSIRAASYKGVNPTASFGCWTGSGGGTSTAIASGAAVSIGTLVAAADTADVPSGAPTNGFMVRNTSPLFGDLFLDARATTTGLQSVTVQLSSAGDWVMQAATVPP